MKTVIDEVLNGEPLYQIIDEVTGKVISGKAKIFLTTPVLQEGSPINKALFDSIKGDVYRVDKYTAPEYVEGIKSTYNNKKGEYIGLWGNSRYSKYGISVYANSEDGENYAYRAMNGVEGYWMGGVVPTIATPALFDIKLNKTIRIKKFSIEGANSSLYCKTFKLQGSDDGENYFDIQSITNNTYSKREYTTSSNVFYQYYRLSITASASDSAFPAILEFNITEWDELIYYNQIRLDGITLTNYEDNQRLLLDLVDVCDNQFLSNVLPPFRQTNQDGYLIQSSGDYINTSVIDAFDYDSENTYWRSLETQTDRYIMITMPINVIPSMFTIKMANITNGIIQGSNDGDNWDTLAENIETTDGETVEIKEIAVGTTNRYRMFKFSFNAKTQNTSSLIYTFDITRGLKGGFNYSRETYVNINGLGDRQVSNDSIAKEGNYELVYVAGTQSYTAYLMSFERATLENTFTNAEKEKLAGIEVGAEVNIIDGVKVNGQEFLPDSNRVINLTEIERTSNKVGELDGSNTNYPTCAAVEKGLENAGQYINMDDIPTKNSQNPVTSDGIYEEFENVYEIIGDVESLLSSI